MPELPEVETVRRMLERTVVGRTIAGVRVSGLALRSGRGRGLAAALRGRTIQSVERRGKFLIVPLDGGRTVVSHLGMSGRWLFFEGESAARGERPAARRPVAVAPRPPMNHVHARIAFRDGSELWFQDPRRFGSLKAVASAALVREPSLARLGRDPVHAPPSADDLARLAAGTRVSVKNFLLDQRRIAGIGNIYASEILHRAHVDPRRAAGAMRTRDWAAVAREIPAVLGEAIAKMGTTFSMYRTLWNEPGGYGEQLLVYERTGEPCRSCGAPIRRIVQGQRSTFFCPTCQSPARRRASGPHSARVKRTRAVRAR